MGRLGFCFRVHCPRCDEWEAYTFPTGPKFGSRNEVQCYLCGYRATSEQYPVKWEECPDSDPWKPPQEPDQLKWPTFALVVWVTLMMSTLLWLYLDR